MTSRAIPLTSSIIQELKNKGPPKSLKDSQELLVDAQLKK